MKYLKIKNKGELDIRLLSLMGATSKRNSPETIGMFGSGNKYALAYLLKTNNDFHIFIGDNKVDIKTEKEEIRNQVFNVLYLNNEKTSITDSMGPDWTAWMVVREIYSNAIDEGGYSHEVVDSNSLKGEDNHTTFYIELTNEFLEVYNNWNDYFMVDKIPFYEDNNIKVYPQKGPMKIYKQGILIKKFEQESLFNYDIKKATLNELREYTGSLEYDVYHAIAKFGDPKVIQYFVENLTEEMYESTIDYDYWSIPFSNTWVDTLKDTKVIHQKAIENLESRGIEVDKVSNIVVPEKLYKGLSTKIEGVGALRASKAVNEFFEIYNERLHDKVRKAEKLLEDCGYFMEPELTYIYGVFGDKTTLAKVCLDSKKIYISEKHLDTDLFSIMTMLVEENEHFRTGFTDCSRSFQQHFINLYTNQLVEKSKVDLFN